MPSYTTLSDDKIQSELSTLAGWEREGDRIAKTYTFGSFREAVSFIVRVSYVCEDHNHHPELSNVYNRVTLAFTTHDAGNTITDMDVTVAREIEELAWV